MTLGTIIALCSFVLAVFAFDIPDSLRVSHDLRQALWAMKEDESSILLRQGTLRLEYGIFRGRSAVRDLSDEQQHLFDVEFAKELSRTAVAALLLLQGLGDAAHEVVLGVTKDNVEGAEYAATHPGQTNWLREHPLTATDDMLHSIIHRCEGDRVGEGNHTGWENAKYWAAGGPKRHESFLESRQHPVHRAMADHIQAKAKANAICDPLRDLVVNRDLSCPRSHSAIADGGKRRNINVGPGCWDPFRFIDLCCQQQQQQQQQRQRQVRSDMNDFLVSEQLEALQVMEMRLLLLYELRQKLGLDCEELLPLL